MKNCRSSQKGFTIVEMMIVVVIIGVLVSIAVPNYTNIVARAEKSACQANKRAIEMARLYNFVNNGSYGLSMSDLSDAFADIGFIGDSSQSDLVCPSDGTYVFETGTFEVTCSIVEHNS